MKRNKKSIFVEWLLKTKRHLRSKAPAWCESSGQAALFYSLPDEQINTAKLSSCKVPHEPFCGGSCTPDGGERPTFFISFLSLNFIKSTSAILAPIWCYGIVLMCHKNLILTTTLDRAITQNPCYVPLNLEAQCSN